MKWVQLCSSLNILWHCLSLGLEWKLTFSRFADILSAALSQHHPSGFEIAQLEFHHPLALFVVVLPKAHLTSHSRMSGSRWVIIYCDYLGHEDLFCTVLQWRNNPRKNEGMEPVSFYTTPNLRRLPTLSNAGLQMERSHRSSFIMLDETFRWIWPVFTGWGTSRNFPHVWQCQQLLPLSLRPPAPSRGGSKGPSPSRA